MLKRRVSVLFVPFGTQLVAATRYRVHQYLPYLEAQGIDGRIFSLISERTTRMMINAPCFHGVKKYLYYLRVMLERFIRSLPVLFLSRRHSLVFFQRATLPFGMERLLRLFNPNIIFDLDDAIYMPDSKEAGVAGFLKERIKASEVSAMLRAAKLAIVENGYLKAYARQYCARIAVIPGPIDARRNFVAQAVGAENRRVVIGWIGSPATTAYLGMLDNILRDLARSFDIEIRLIGAGNYQIEGVRVVNIPWSYADEVRYLQGFDIGIMPMPVNPWTKGKLGCKLLQYMAVGVPSVVTRTDTTSEMVEDGVNGFLAGTEGEWRDKLSLLINDPPLRRQTGMAGRKTIEERCSLEVNGPKLISLMRQCLSMSVGRCDG